MGLKVAAAGATVCKFLGSIGHLRESFEFVRGKDEGATERRIGPSMLWGVEGLGEALS